MPTLSPIQQNLQAVRQRISAAELRFGRVPHSVQLLAVSKAHSIEKIQEAYQLGQDCFGENQVQAALVKMESLKALAITWHFIGSIQSNKTRLLAEHFAWVHSVDTYKSAQRLHEQRPIDLPPLNICLQVNIAGETSKTGITDFAELVTLAERCRELPRLQLRGVMAIPPADPDPVMQRTHCHAVKNWYNALQQRGFTLDTLSLGMSGDLEAAIAEGATLVRIGRDVFGAR